MKVLEPRLDSKSYKQESFWALSLMLMSRYTFEPVHQKGFESSQDTVDMCKHKIEEMDHTHSNNHCTI
jgi:hypothetical protein